MDAYSTDAKLVEYDLTVLADDCIFSLSTTPSSCTGWTPTRRLLRQFIDWKAPLMKD